MRTTQSIRLLRPPTCSEASSIAKVATAAAEERLAKSELAQIKRAFQAARKRFRVARETKIQAIREATELGVCGAALSDAAGVRRVTLHTQVHRHQKRERAKRRKDLRAQRSVSSPMIDVVVDYDSTKA